MVLANLHYHPPFPLGLYVSLRSIISEFVYSHSLSDFPYKSDINHLSHIPRSSHRPFHNGFVTAYWLYRTGLQLESVVGNRLTV